MQMRLADFVAEFLLQNGITACFTVTGGGAMHLNDALGHKQGLRCIYQHHEQACAMAAEAYARVENRTAAVCVTSGPGGTNALTGVLGAYLDSVPMLVLSGQVRYDTTVRSTALPLRSLGDQEFDIVRAAATMTKYAVMLEDPKQIRYELEKALYLAREGRPGPCWIDIPLNFQGAMIDPDTLPGFDASAWPTLAPVCEADLDLVVTRLMRAKRPVIYAGSAIRTAGVHNDFLALAARCGIPIVTAWNAVDVLPTAHPLYVGRGGMLGDRAGNLAVECADVILALGTRLSVRQVGYHYDTWAKDAFVIAVDADEAELKKPTVHISHPIHADLRDFLPKLIAREDLRYPANGWQKRCADLRTRYPVVQAAHRAAAGLVNPYAFLDALSEKLPEAAITVVGNGSACVMGSQAWHVRAAQRFLINSGAASMGYDLPAAIGAAVAAGREVLCVTGEGSIQMNLQELQTILTNHLPVRVFLINNGGYHSIRQTQQNAFPHSAPIGIGAESGDLEFPLMQKLAHAYGYVYLSCADNAKLEGFLEAALQAPAPLIAEVFVDPAQRFEPKSATQKLPDGSLYSPPLYDLAPFLPREELDAVIKELKNQ